MIHLTPLTPPHSVSLCLPLSPSVSQAGPAHVLHPSGGIPSPLSSARDECIHVQVSGSSSAQHPHPPKGRHLICAASVTCCNHISAAFFASLFLNAGSDRWQVCSFLNRRHCLHCYTVTATFYGNGSGLVLTNVLSASDKYDQIGVRTTKGCEDYHRQVQLLK